MIFFHFGLVLYAVFVLIEPYNYGGRNLLYILAMSLIGAAYLLDDIKRYLQRREPIDAKRDRKPALSSPDNS